MKIFNGLLLLCVILTACAPDVPPPSQPSDTAVSPTDQQEALVEEWEQKKQAIDTLLENAQLHQDSLAFECENSGEGGRLSLFKQGEELRLLRYAYYADGYQSGIINAYVEEGRLFYAHVEESVWSFDEEAPKSNRERHIKEDYTHYTYYYDPSGQAIRCLQKDYVVRSAVELPTEANKIKANEIGCGGAQVIQRLFEQLMAVDTVADLVEVLCSRNEAD